MPAGVDPADWSVLANSSASADDIALAILRIVTSIRDRLTLESPSAYSIISEPEFDEAGNQSETNSLPGCSSLPEVSTEVDNDV